MRPLAVAVLGRGLVDPDEPIVTADDAGLTRGQAAFETVRVYAGRPFALDQHLDRLSASASRLELPTVAREDLVGLARQALEAANAPDCALRLYWTGGREDSAQATALALVSPLPTGFDQQRRQGLRVVALDLGIDIAARARSPWLLGGVKSTSYAVNIAARTESRRRDADDAVLVASDGTVLEAPTSNIWWRSGSSLCTPSLALGILSGVTRAVLQGLAPALGYAVEEGAWPLKSLLSADEAFTTSSLREVMPVVSVDGQPIGDGRPGSAAATLQQRLRQAASAEVELA
jgi:4-amino-4-deoxychorismate lyase